MQGGPVPRAGGNLRSTSETWSGHRSFRRWRSTLLRLKGSRRTGLCLLYAFFFSLFFVVFDSLPCMQLSSCRHLAGYSLLLLRSGPHFLSALSPSTISFKRRSWLDQSSRKGLTHLS